jgi:hypothetical protein
MRIQVTTLYHDTDGGGELTVHPSEDAATDAKHEIAVSSWDNVFCPDGEDCDVEDCRGVPLDPSALDRDAAIDAYFSHRQAFESATVVAHEIDMPLPALVGDWVTRAQREVDLSYVDLTYTLSSKSSAFRALIEELLTLDIPDAA